MFLEMQRRQRAEELLVTDSVNSRGFGGLAHALNRSINVNVATFRNVPILL
jgi:hypothetical protein